jgi:hypothetical protein
MGTFTINTTAPQDARLVAAFGKRLAFSPPRNATAAEVKAEIINMIVGVVREQELATTLADTIASMPPPIVPT